MHVTSQLMARNITNGGQNASETRFDIIHFVKALRPTFYCYLPYKYFQGLSHL